ncbi:MAG: gliding motility-associated ABC transporter ATP-binding subunit GldA [Bacteroidetes bacterium]|nr:gliding motility-associated ABC transporter ATP-binding subunit GldA [Bacteroidota bacterium]
MSIEVQQITKKYGEQLAVNDISFTISKGEIVGFLGPNGAGKSTTMKILTCFIPPSSGTARVCGFDTGDNSLQVRQKVGYLPEHNPLYLDMYVKEYLAFAAELGGVNKVRKRVAEIVDLTNLGREQHKKLKQLSKGYRQRVGLAQAMIHDPEVLILDEPTSGLDPNQVVEIRDLIKTLGKEKTIMLSTHIMQEVEAICDRVIIIDKGNIVADDKLANLRNNRQGSVIVRVQFGTRVTPEDLLTIQGCMSAKETGENTWKLEGNFDGFRAAVSQFALGRNLEVLELVTEKNSLEEIFRTLTGHVGHL